ncbi:MAG: TolC family protein [Bacteroidota bacterium]
MLRKTLILVWLFATVLCTTAQDTNPNGDLWDLRRCLEYALETNLTLKQALLDRQVSKVNLNESLENRYPSLSAGSNARRFFGRNVNPFTNEFVETAVNSLDMSANSSVPIFRGLRTANTIKRNRLTLDASEMDIEDARNTVALDVTAAYLSILLNQELLESAELQVSNTREQRERTNKLVEAGQLARNSLFELDAQIATEELNVVNARNQVELAYLQLMQVMNLDPGQPFGIIFPEMGDPDAMHPANPDEIYQYAESNQPNIKAANLRILSAEKDVAVSRGIWMPTLNLFGNISTGYADGRSRLASSTLVIDEQELIVDGTPVIVGFPDVENTFEDIPLGDQLNDNVNYGFGLSLNIPIYSNGFARASVQRSQISMQRARNNMDIQRQQLRQTIERAHLDAVSAFAAYNQGIKQLDQLQLALDNTKKQYEVGTANATDFLVASNNLIRAQNDVIRFKYDYIFKSKILDFYQDKPIGF